MRYRTWLALVAIGFRVGSASGQDTFTGVDRIVAVGDVHGDYNQFVTVLRQAGVLDAKNHWAGGRTHFVQTGDVLDRGPDSRKVMDLLMVLGPEAERAGGRVHALIGNHEAMNVLGDLRYVSPGEYRAFETSNAFKLRGRAYRALGDSTRIDDADYQKQWETEHPLGWVEHRLAFEGNGRYGTWIRGHNAAVKINGSLFLHGGIGPAYADMPLADLNAQIRAALAPDAEAAQAKVAEDPEGPLWYRGLASGQESALTGHVDHVLASFGITRVVIGHTVTAGTVMPRFGGKVIMIDVGLSAVYGGPPACLVIEGEKAYALHRGQKLEIPTDGDILPYLRSAAALDPAPSRLQKLIDQLEGTTAGTPPL